LERPDYWWYRARSDLLERTLGDFVSDRDHCPRILDVGSADGPSVGWLRQRGRRIGMDIDPRGLGAGDVCASAMSLPFASSSFDVVAAFDVIEHCDPEARVLAEIHRVLAPGGRLLMSVPAYEWAWTSHDDHNQHHRRYTRRRAVAAVRAEDFEVLRATYVFGATFPLFAVDRLRRRVAERARPSRERRDDGVPTLPEVNPRTEQLLMGLTSIDRRILARWNLPVGSSVVLAARKPGNG
jgi:SAM-dependent methyltransferase